MSATSYKAWAVKNPERAISRWKEWKDANPEKAAEAYKKWYEANKEVARQQKREVMKRLRTDNPEKYKAQSRKAKIKEKLSLFEMYGCKCAMCGFDDMRALSLDHKNNNGNIEREELGIRGTYRRAKEEYRPEEYQILCMNCQFIKRSIYSNHIDLNIEWRQQHSIFCQKDSNDPN